MIPEAIEALHDAPPSLTGLMYVVGLAFFLAMKSVAGLRTVLLAWHSRT